MRFIQANTSLRIELDNNNKYNYTETPYMFITCVSVVGTDIVIQSDQDPNNQNLVYPYASVIEPVTANITELKEVLWCWILSNSRKDGDINGDPYILHLPDVDPCFGVISSAACPGVLQNVNGDLYFDGVIVGGGGGGITDAESGLYLFNPTTARLGGPFLEDIYHDAAGFEYFCSNFSTWRVQLGAGDLFAAIICDAARTRISRGTGSLEIATPGVNNSTAQIGGQLALTDPATGQVEYTEFAQNSGEVYELLSTTSFPEANVSQVRYYGFNTNLSASQLILPPNPRLGRTITMYDRNGNAPAFPLILNGNGHLIVDSAGPSALKYISTTYGSITVMFAGSASGGANPLDGSVWYVIAKT